MNAPAWLRCEYCLWWKSSADPGEGWGCTYDGIPKPTGAFDRCHLWTCKRCLLPWDWYGDTGAENHLYCKRSGRAKPKVRGRN